MHPDAPDSLAPTPTPGTDPGQAPRLADRLCADLVERWQRGQPVPVEAYLEDQPGLDRQYEAVFELILTEVVLREAAGQAVTLEEYLRRFPQFADQLRRHFVLREALDLSCSVHLDSPEDAILPGDEEIDPRDDDPTPLLAAPSPEKDLSRPDGNDQAQRPPARRKKRTLQPQALVCLAFFALGAVAATAIILTNLHNQVLNDTAAELQREKRAHTHLTEALAGVQRSLYQTRVALAQRLLYANQPDHAFRVLDLCLPELRHWEWHYLDGQRWAHLATLETQGNPAGGLAFSPDGKYLAAGGLNGQVQVWDCDKGKRVGTLEARGGRVALLAFDTKGRWLVAAGDRPVTVWDFATRKVVHNLDGKTWAAFSPDGSLLATGGRKEVILWNSDTGERVRTLSGFDHESACGHFSADGKVLAACDYGRGIRRWDVATGKEIGPAGELALGVIPLQFLPDGNRLLVWSQGSTWVVDAATGKDLGQPKPPTGGLPTLAVSPDGQWVAHTGPDHTVVLCEPGIWRPAHRFWGHKQEVHCLAFSGSGLRLASGSADGTIKIWSLVQGQEVRYLGKGLGPIPGVAQTPDGRLLALVLGPDGAQGAGGKEVCLFDATAARRLDTLPGRGAAVFSPDEALLALGGQGHAVVIHDHRAKKQIRALGKGLDPADQLTFRPDGRRLAASDRGGTIRVWDPTADGEAREFREHQSPLVGLGFEPGGRFLLSACTEGHVVVWDADQFTIRARWKAPPGLVCSALAPQGDLLACSGKDHGIQLWEVPGGKLVRSLTGHTQAVSGLAFSPDGKRLVSGGADRTVRLWDVGSGQELLSLPGVGEGVRGLLFSRDGRRIYATGQDGLLVWEGR